MYNLPKGYLSSSQINTYLMCPKSYMYKYVENMPSKINDKLAIGRAVSVGLYMYNINRNNKGWEDMTKFEISKELEAYQSELGESITNDIYVTSVDCVSAYVNYIKNNKLDNYIVVAAEDKREFDINGIKVVYIPDLIKSDIATLDDIIVDYKTTAMSRYSPEMLKYDIQTSIYSLAEGINAIEIHEIKKPTKKKPTQISIIPCEKTPQAIDDVVEVIEDTAKAITAGIFPKCEPNHWKCSKTYCEYWDICRGEER